jgi:ABC-2 type transport system ATP-binding protein
MEEAISIRGLRKVFRSGAVRVSSVVALEGLDLSVRRGEVFGLLGPNGSGKSTTIKICLDLVRATAGECLVFGQGTSRPATRARLGYVPEAPFFYAYLTGRGVVASMGRFSGLSGKDLEERTNRAIRTVGLEGAEDRPIRTYSKGMLQRLGLAQALVHDPDLVILDEPTAGVDPIGARQITELIRLLRSEGKTILLCSHLLSQVESVCDRVAILHRGRKIAEGTLGSLLERTGRRRSLAFGDEATYGKAKRVLAEAGLPAEEDGGGGGSLEEVFVSLVREGEAKAGREGAA